MIEELDKGQEEALYAEPGRPMLVTGPARSGKSFTAILRAMRMLHHWPWRRKRLLFLSTAGHGMLVATNDFKQFLTEEKRDLIDIVPPGDFCNAVWTQRNYTGRNGYGLAGTLHFPRFMTGFDNDPVNVGKRYLGPDVGALFAEAFSQTPRIGGLSESAARREFADVVQEWDVRTKEAYLALDRPPFFGSLSETAQTELWDRLFGPAVALLAKAHRRRGRGHAGELNCVRDRILAGGKNADTAFLPKRYGAIIVDDAQNLCPALLRFLATLVPNGNLFLCADTTQTLFQPQALLADCGIDVRGRVIHLRANHSQSTGAIQTYARNLLKGLAITDLDGSPAALPAPVPMAGALPEERTFSNRKAMYAAIADWVKQGAEPDGDFGCAIYSRCDRRALHQLTESLEACGVPCNRYSSEGFWVIALTTQTYHYFALPNSQARNIVIILDDWLDAQWEHDFDGDPAARKARAEWALRVLYATLMRAVERVLIVSSNGMTVNKLKEEAQ